MDVATHSSGEQYKMKVRVQVSGTKLMLRFLTSKDQCLLEVTCQLMINLPIPNLNPPVWKLLSQFNWIAMVCSNLLLCPLACPFSKRIWSGDGPTNFKSTLAKSQLRVCPLLSNLKRNLYMVTARCLMLSLKVKLSNLCPTWPIVKTGNTD